MFKFYDIEQNKEEWYQVRAGKLGGSSFGKVAANMGKAFGDPAKKLAMSLAVERITGLPVDRGGHQNAHTERGSIQEADAIAQYEKDHFCDTSNGGFFDCGHVGISPDRLVNDDGIIEVKSVIPSVHFLNVQRGSFDPAYKWQYIGNLYYSQRDYMDFVSYCAEYPDGKRLYTCTIKADKVKTEIEQLIERVEEFNKLVEDYREVILNSNYEVTYQPKPTK